MPEAPAGIGVVFADLRHRRLVLFLTRIVAVAIYGPQFSFTTFPSAYALGVCSVFGRFRPCLLGGDPVALRVWTQSVR